MDTIQLQKDFGKLLKKNHQEFRNIFSSMETDCYRVYNWNISEIPWLIDIYGNYLHISSLAQTHQPDLLEAESELLETASRMLYVPLERIFCKHRFVQGRQVTRKAKSVGTHIDSKRTGTSVQSESFGLFGYGSISRSQD